MTLFYHIFFGNFHYKRTISTIEYLQLFSLQANHINDRVPTAVFITSEPSQPSSTCSCFQGQNYFSFHFESWRYSFAYVNYRENSTSSLKDSIKISPSGRGVIDFEYCFLYLDNLQQQFTLSHFGVLVHIQFFLFFFISYSCSLIPQIFTNYVTSYFSL